MKYNTVNNLQSRPTCTYWLDTLIVQGLRVEHLTPLFIPATIFSHTRMSGGLKKAMLVT